MDTQRPAASDSPDWGETTSGRVPGTVKVLLVASPPRDAERLRGLLARSAPDQFDLTHVEQFDKALDCLREEHFDVSLLDLSGPGASGARMVSEVRGVAGGLPIVVLLGADQEPLALAAVRAGAQDYVIKERDDGRLIVRSIRYAIERKLAEERLTYLAHYDPLTGLANRILLRDQLRGTLARVERTGQLVALLFVGVDRFKGINDTLGHDAGDALLRAVAERLRGSLRSADTVARFEGDVFAVVLEGIRRVPDAEGEAPWPEAGVARRFLMSLGAPFILGGQEVFVTASVGIALYPRDGPDEHTLIRSADKAMRHAKAQGGNTYRYYTSVMNVQVVERLALESSLRHALERDEFRLHYQPQVDFRSRRVVGVEALLRWQHPERGLVSPAEFVPVAEESGLIQPIGEWVLRTACAQNRAWQAEGLPRVRVSVNVSASQFRQSALVHTIARSLKGAELEAHWLELEVTESVLMHNTEVSRATLSQMKAMELRLCIDDFGTGYSSLAYLKRFPVDVIKIDRSFVADITIDADAAAIVTAIITLAHSLRLSVVAEGVETKEQLAFLDARGCDAMQGFVFSRPIPPDAIAALLREGLRLERPGPAA